MQYVKWKSILKNEKPNRYSLKKIVPQKLGE